MPFAMRLHFTQLFFLMSFLFLPSCEKKESIESTLDLNKTFRFFSTAAIPTMDWNKASDTTSSMIIENLMEGLLAYDFSKKMVSYKPALAEKIESKNEGQKWILTLKKNVYWSDGVLFTGRHILDSWERLLNPKTASPFSYFLFHIKNAREYNEGKIKDFSKVALRWDGKHKIEIELTGPKHFFPFTLTHTTTFPIRKDLIKKYGPRWTAPQNIATLGPYRLHHWQQDQLIILKKSETYHGLFPGDAENVTIKIIPELSTALNLFAAKKLDLINLLPSKQLAFYKKKPEYKSYPRLTIYYYGFQIEKPPFDNPLFRKAFVMGVDRKQITDLMGADAIPLKGWVPQNLFGHNPQIGLSFNPKKAKELLEKSGLKKPLPKIVISYNTNEDHKRIAENIQAQLKKNLGLGVELANEEWKVYLNTLQEKNVAVFRLGWQADYPDPDNFMAMITSYSANNHTSWENLEFDRLVEEASKLPNNQKRQALYNRAQKILTEIDTAVFPILTDKSKFLISNRVQYFPFNIMGAYLFKEVRLKEK